MFPASSFAYRFSLKWKRWKHRFLFSGDRWYFGHHSLRMYEDYQNINEYHCSTSGYVLSCSWTSSLEASSVAETGQAEAYQKRGGLGKRCWEPKGKQNQRNKIQQSSFGQQSDSLCKRFWGVRVHVIYKFVSDCGGGGQAEWTGRTQVADRGACATPDDVCQLRCWVILYIDIYWRSTDIWMYLYAHTRARRCKSLALS